MKLITKEIETAFAKQGCTAGLPADKIKIICKLFNPAGAGIWYLYEKETEDIYWAFVNLNDPLYAESGTISLNELKEVRFPPFGLTIERDMYFELGGKTLQEVKDIVKAGGHV